MYDIVQETLQVKGVELTEDENNKNSKSNYKLSGFLGLLHVDHLNQMDGQRCYLVQKQGADYENALSPTHIWVDTKVISSLNLKFSHYILQGIMIFMMCRRTLVEIRHLISFLLW